jgi:hypothetical protein
MSNVDDEKKMGDLIREACRPVEAPPGVKGDIRVRLVAQYDSRTQASSKLWDRPKVMVPILASIAGGLIVYGCLISTQIV